MFPRQSENRWSEERVRKKFFVFGPVGGRKRPRVFDQMTKPHPTLLVRREVGDVKWSRGGRHSFFVCLGGRFGGFTACSIGFLNTLDNTDGNSLSHVTDSESSEGWILCKGLDAHWL
jgi:hypothetical protein